jgi:hypothetical protein
MDNRRETGGVGRRALLPAILLVILGIVLLLNTTGVVGWGIWLSLFRFWPLILIAVGLNIILGRRFPVVSALLVTLILCAGVTAAYLFERTTEPGHFLGESRHSWTLNDADILEMEIDFGAGSLSIDSGVSTGADELFVVRASGIDAAVIPAHNSARAQNGGGYYGYSPIGTDGRVAVTLSPNEPRDLRVAHGGGWDIDIDLWGLFQSLGDINWEVGISPDVVVGLDIEAGAADIDLDLSELTLETLDMDMGAADVNVVLPADSGHTDVSIDAGAADIDISIPDNVAAMITTDTAVTSIDVDTARFPMSDGVYRSLNYETALNRVEINIDAGVSSVSIH